jgi:hypothetical protein
MDDGELLPLIAAVVGSLFVIRLSSIVALIAEEEETNALAMALINTAGRGLARAVISLRRGSPELLDEPPPKKASLCVLGSSKSKAVYNG